MSIPRVHLKCPKDIMKSLGIFGVVHHLVSKKCIIKLLNEGSFLL
jgi:hypothetical protein